MSFRTRWYNSTDVRDIAAQVQRDYGIGIEVSHLLDAHSRDSGAFGANMERKLINQGMPISDVRALLDF